MQSINLDNNKMMHYLDATESFPSSGVIELARLIRQWATVFPREESWVKQNYNVPSLIVRCDCTLLGDQVGLYEIEDRPAGIGVTTLINSDFREHLNSLTSQWPKFVVVSSDSRRLDDRFWVTEIPLTEFNSHTNASLVYPRFNPSEAGFSTITSDRFVSTFKYEGDKAYGVDLGLWKIVTNDDAIEDDFWKAPFALKPFQGTRCDGLVVYSPEPSAKRPPGSSSRKKVANTLNSNRAMYRQPVLGAKQSTHLSGHYIIFRFYFGYSPNYKTYVPMGGLWNSRPSTTGSHYRIHGANDAVFGPIKWE